MGTHPIFESDFDCLTDDKVGGVAHWRHHFHHDLVQLTHWRPPYPLFFDPRANSLESGCNCFSCWSFGAFNPRAPRAYV